MTKRQRAFSDPSISHQSDFGSAIFKHDIARVETRNLDSTPNRGKTVPYNSVADVAKALNGIQIECDYIGLHGNVQKAVSAVLDVSSRGQSKEDVGFSGIRPDADA